MNLSVPTLSDLVVNTILQNATRYNDVRSELAEHLLQNVFDALNVTGRLTDDTLCVFLPKSTTCLSLKHATRLTDVGIMSLIMLVGSQLTHLNVSGTKITSNGIAALAGGCANLRSLTLIGNSHVRSESIQYLANNCPMLQELDLRECNALDLSTWEICLTMPHLASLNLGSCTNIVFPKYPLIMEQIGEAETVKALQEISDSDSSDSPKEPSVPDQYNESIIYLSLNSNPRIDDSAVSHLVGKLKKLKSLDLTCTRITDDATLYIATSHSRDSLEILHVSYTNTTDEGLIRIAAGCRNIRNLAIQGCLGVTEKSMIYIIAHFKTKLNSLSLGGCSGISRFGLHLLFNHIRGLSFVYLSSVLASNDVMSDYSIEGLSENKQLKTIYLSKSRITDVALEKLASEILVSVDVSHCPLLTSAGVTRFIDTCPNLTSLDISGTRFDDVMELNDSLKKLANLQHLHILNFSLLNDELLDTIAQNPNMKSVSIGSDWVTEEAVMKLLLNCESLENFVLEKKELSSRFFAVIAQQLTQECRYLWIKKCKIPKVSAGSDDVAAFVSRCPKLRILFLPNSPQLGSKLCIQLAQSCSQLEHLNLKNNEDITSSGIGRLVEGCPGLRNVSLSGTAVTDRGLWKLKNCKLLNTLGLVDCRYITQDGVLELLKSTKDCLRYLFLTEGAIHHDEAGKPPKFDETFIHKLMAINPILRVDSIQS